MIKALLVDDEIRTLEVLGKKVHWKDCGIDHLFTAETMDDALQCCQKYRPELLITDIEMPDGSGLELIERLRQEGTDISCLCITCHPEFGYMRKAMQLGSCDYILKPIEYEELETVLKRIVNRINEKKLKLDETQEYITQTAGLQEDEKLVLNAQNYIRQHLTENLNVGDIAGQLHCSASHLMHAFKRKSGKTVIEYITAERMEKAKRLLRESELQVSAIAKLSGYEDYSYFTRVFKREFGVAPREYRGQYRVL